MKNMKKKGFTLVELLVVIAILAILATVSVIGYTAFVEKADQSKAVTELTQVKTLVKGELMVNNAKVTVDETEYTISLGTDGLIFKTGATQETDNTKKTAALKEFIKDDIDFEDKLAVTDAGDVTYTDDSGASAKWTVSTDKVEAN